MLLVLLPEPASDGRRLGMTKELARTGGHSRCAWPRPGPFGGPMLIARRGGRA